MDFQLDRFVFDRVLNEDPATHSVALLGTLRSSSSKTSDDQTKTAIVRIEKTALPSFSDGLITTTKLVENTDIYAWMLGWLSHSEDRPDVKINVIYPATDVHIRKYSKQHVHIVRETPALYERIVKPYIDAFPTSRTQWFGFCLPSLARAIIHRSQAHAPSYRIEEIISGRAEAEKILFRSPPSADPFGFLILPDMKWDLVSLSSLYLVALTLLPKLKSLRDLNRSHLPLLRSIQREAANVVKSHWDLEAAELRLFIHYQPSYYHFHVHIVNANHTGLTGMTVGQAHLLDDVVSLLELDEPTGPSIFQRMTISYGLGEQHGLFSAMKAAQLELQEGGEQS
ncbi:scavenger mRNA decapping enzyme [Russula dissimulans]|nr:scavenger mRNA decapping enzyme [Russula dissimulans]